VSQWLIDVDAKSSKSTAPSDALLFKKLFPTDPECIHKAVSPAVDD